jgi:hypothetical protein
VSAGYGTTTTRSYMPGLFDALKNMPKRGPKKFFITVQGEQHEVTLEKKLWAQQHGEENLILRDGEIVVKPTPKPKTRYSVLKKATKGYTFHDNDIHWPNKIVEGGVTWQIESE